MNDSELKELLFRIGARCNIEQYSLLKRCSENRNITEWNNWRRDNPKKEIWLSGADLLDAHLKGVDLFEAHLEGAYLIKTHLEGAFFQRAHLEGAIAPLAHLKSADLINAHLEGAELFQAHLEDAKLGGAHLERAELSHAHLEGANLKEAHLEGARLKNAHLEGSHLYRTHLQRAKLIGTNLEAVTLQEARLQGACFDSAIVNGRTLIRECHIDRKTDFTGVGLDSARVEPRLKQLLKYNIRRIGWNKWYKDHRLLKLLVLPFWKMSDYGRSTGWIICTFFGLALLFAVIYWVWGLIWHPGIVANLFQDEQGPIPTWLVFFRAVYFSIVTMTTLGFGDMYANARSLAGHVCLGIQVLLGYVLLGALVTRFAVLFTAGGPAAKFADEKTIRQRLAQVLRGCAKLFRRRKG